MKILRSLITYVNVLFFFLILIFFLYPFYLVCKIFLLERYVIRFSFVMMRVCIKISLWLAGIKVVVTGSENIPLQKGNVIIMGNHIAAMDPLIFIYTFASPFVILAKHSLLRVPFLNIVLIVMGTIFVNRKRIRSAAAAEVRAIKVMKEGRSIGIFPEGTRNRGGDTKVFKKGAFKMALKTGTSILPVTLCNTNNFFIKNIIFNSGLSVYIHIHPLVDILSLSEYEKDNLASIIRDQIVKKLETIKI
ncbi:1-acyl-sn-glycerol-3-phosphate acyltransferase [Borrelia sp. CA_690]|uniref:1-acyl-sn-glycerol-3-phosphate acyltransferase n=1 Tax=Borrelia maritima TaxID=2761123 RepID=A0A5J6W9M3_9SPIR|nr:MULTISPECIES: 1-acyl-sn-glycerol-3-phosphate acyltransferase [Borrelia]QFI14200.1 1-acyl-sn-glycerol-3-phosphate acyltransferase [Borrelia maritima]WKC84052.1 1-acyl-sn-glycerol-3-phosphate acyltransferase [Borrelia sp. CA_690]